MNIRTKISIGYLLILCIVIPAFYGMTVYQHNNIRDKEILIDIEHFKAAFGVLLERDTKTLAAGLEVIIQDPGIKEKFLSNDRDALFQYGEPLFKNLKEKYGITHFYFIMPDGKCFLRLHNKNIYGDRINRYTFLRARETQSIATGIELGKTAFALRAVMPYYHEGKLIGYIELGEEIDHFLEIMKEESGDEYAILADKDKLSREDWRSVRKVAGLRDNWGDSEKHLVVSQTTNSKLLEKCSDEEAIERVEKGENELHKLNNESGSYVCTGFGINDAAEKHVGALLSPLNITLFTSSMEKFNNNAIIFSGILLLISSIGIIIFSASITKPLSKLEDAAKMMEDGNLETKKVDIRSNDEIGMLARAFNSMAEKLRDSLSSLTTKNAEVEKIVYITSHDLRAPLVNVAGYHKEVGYSLQELQAILKDAELPEDVKEKIAFIIDKDIPESVNYIDASVAKMDSLLAGLLRLSRSGKTELHIENLDMNRLVSDVLDSLQYQFKEKGARYEIAELPPCTGDERQINQAFSNLIWNAIKYLDPKRPGLIRISGRKDDGNIIYCVEDNGIGIAPEDQEKIFEIFHRVQRGKGGEGLGLSIVKKIVERDNGKIWVESVVGKGSKFYVSLPAGQAGLPA
ncbi:MAG: ATP-binding protein [Thermodesulfovibrionia bacterium]|nr:ATP-binding protein [Thermodesulfovibrionia bacterium]